MPRQENKPRRKNLRRRKPRKKQNRFLRFLRRTPSWLLWLAGTAIAGLYAFLLYYIFVGPFSMRWRAQYGSVPEPKDYEIRGIDISHYQKAIDWAKVKEANVGGFPVNFVIIKATEGININDSHFSQNIQKARHMNLICGAYHFYIPGSDVKKQVQNFTKHVQLKSGDLPPILDVEKKGSLSKKELQHDVLEWLTHVEKHYGVTPIIYASHDFKKSYLQSRELERFPLWIARYYKEELEYNGAWAIWQYTDVGEVDGIQGKVDCNIFNGNLHDLKLLLIKEDF